MALVPAGLSLLAVLIFVLQNPQRGTVRFLFLSGQFPIGAALLAAVALGGAAVFFLGSVRILQLRRLARRRPAGAAEPVAPAAPTDQAEPVDPAETAAKPEQAGS